MCADATHNSRQPSLHSLPVGVLIQMFVVCMCLPLSGVHLQKTTPSYPSDQNICLSFSLTHLICRIPHPFSSLSPDFPSCQVMEGDRIPGLHVRRWGDDYARKSHAHGNHTSLKARRNPFPHRIGNNHSFREKQTHANSLSYYVTQTRVILLSHPPLSHPLILIHLFET